MNSDFKHRHHHISFKSALNGLILAVLTEINMKIIIAASLIVVLLGLIFNISYYEWLVIIMVIGMVYLSEMINTSIEAVTDLVTTEWKEEAKVSKDVAAGMVLVSSIVASVIGIIIFLPRLSVLIDN